jgi:hypothetical protein
MRRLIAQKLALALVTLAFVLTLNFFLFRVVGDPRNDLLLPPAAASAPDEQRINGVDAHIEVVSIPCRERHRGGEVLDLAGLILPQRVAKPVGIPRTDLARRVQARTGVVTRERSQVGRRVTRVRNVRRVGARRGL